jgi:hypothetical protein
MSSFEVELMVLNVTVAFFAIEAVFAAQTSTHYI